MFYILFATMALLLSGQPVSAEDINSDVFQGVIMSAEEAPGYIVVNERKVLLDEDVEVRDSKDREASISDLKRGKWVYIVSMKRTAGLTAMRIYLLPKRIKDKERRNYPFMSREEEPED